MYRKLVKTGFDIEFQCKINDDKSHSRLFNSDLRNHCGIIEEKTVDIKILNLRFKLRQNAKLVFSIR